MRLMVIMVLGHNICCENGNVFDLSFIQYMLNYQEKIIAVFRNCEDVKFSYTSGNIRSNMNRYKLK